MRQTGGRLVSYYINHVAWSPSLGTDKDRLETIPAVWTTERLPRVGVEAAHSLGTGRVVGVDTPATGLTVEFLGPGHECGLRLSHKKASGQL